jgi:hypothetical protein
MRLIEVARVHARRHGRRALDVPMATRTCRYDPTLYIVDSGPDLECSIVYDGDLCGEQTIAALANDFLAWTSGHAQDCGDLRSG